MDSLETPDSWDWSFRTFLRVKPPLHTEALPEARLAFETDDDDDGSGAEGGDGGLLQFHVAQDQDEEGEPVRRIELEVPLSSEPGLIHNNTSGFVPFCFNDVFGPDARQEDIFSSVRDMILDAFAGINCTVLAYGQTGTGKTFSISGGDTFADRGLIPRGVKLMFDEAKARGLAITDASSQDGDHDKATCSLYVSFTEIYGDAVYDLLDAEKRHRPLEEWPRAQVMESDEGLIIRNLNVFQVSSAQDAMNLFFMGTANRLTSSTVMNKASSRSHAIFTLVVETHELQGDNHITRCGKINFVDLAGSERIYKEMNSKDVIREGRAINLSLHYLEQVIISLRAAHHQQSMRQTQSVVQAQKQPCHIPYRNCILTSILRDSLGGNCRSCFLFTVSMDTKQFEETISTCRFAQRVGEVKVRISSNQEVDVQDQLKQARKYVHYLEGRVAELEQEKEGLLDGLELSRAQTRELEERNRADRRLTDGELKANRAVVTSILSGHGSATPSRSPIVDMAQHSPVDNSVPVEHATSNDPSPHSPTPSYSGSFHDIPSLDRASLIDLCTELAKSLATVNAEKRNAMVLQSQTSSSAAAFVASRFAGKARRQSFNKSHTRSASNMSITPPSAAAVSHLATGGSFGVSGPTPPSGRTVGPSPPTSEEHVAPHVLTPTTARGIENSPQISIRPQHFVDVLRLSLQSDVDGEAAAEQLAEGRERFPSDASASIAGVGSPTVDPDGATTADKVGVDEMGDLVRRNDAFIDMLIFGERFLKHGARGVCGNGLRHVSVSTDLKSLCRSHINSTKSMKTIPLTEIDRVEVGHGYPKLKTRENCLLTIIGHDISLDLECFCFDSFQENKELAENWAMALTYCIARAKGQIDEFKTDLF